MVISYFLCNFNVLEINILQSTIAMITEDKVTKILGHLQKSVDKS